MFGKKDRAAEHSVLLHGIGKDGFQNLQVIFARHNRFEELTPHDWIRFYCHIMCFCELLLVSRIGSANTVLKFAKGALDLCAEHFASERIKFAIGDVSESAIRFLFEQVYDGCFETVQPIISKTASGDSAGFQEALVNCLWSRYFPGHDLDSIKEIIGDIANLYLDLSEEIIKFEEKLR